MTSEEKYELCSTVSYRPIYITHCGVNVKKKKKTITYIFVLECTHYFIYENEKCNLINFSWWEHNLAYQEVEYRFHLIDISMLQV